jgi:hypothetical protein
MIKILAFKKLNYASLTLPDFGAIISRACFSHALKEGSTLMAPRPNPNWVMDPL